MKGVFIKINIQKVLRDRLRTNRELLISELRFSELYAQQRERFEKSTETLKRYREEISQIEARLNAGPRQRKIAALKKQLSILERSR